MQNTGFFKEITPRTKQSGRVYLVYTDIYSEHGLPYHPGLASIAAVLLQHGFEVKVGYMSSEDQYEELVQEIIDFEPSVVGFTTVETQMMYVQQLAAKIKQRHECVTVVGGTHITLWPAALVEPGSESLNCGMRGDSEMAFLELVRKVQRGEDYHDAYSLCYRDPNTGEVVNNPMHPPIERMEDLPHPATEVFDFQSIIRQSGRALFHFSRGCPYPCTYCSARELLMRQGSVKEGLKKRSVESTIEEIKLTVQRYDFTSSTILMFTDDLFTLDKKWLYDFLNRYEKEVARPFWCTTRSNLVNRDLFDRLKSAGCYEVMMSIESGNDFIRNDIMKRGMSRKHMLESFALANEFGLRTCGPCIIGFPHETPEMIEDSIDFVSQLNVSDKGVGIFYPYRGTPLRPLCEENGYLPKNPGDFVERQASILNLPTITKGQIQHYFENWERLICSAQGRRSQFGYSIKSALRTTAKTGAGKKLNQIVNNNRYGRKLKEYTLGVLGIT
jgi:radical SAM superfamily enzyme YgiQ (UPF0313 family)